MCWGFANQGLLFGLGLRAQGLLNRFVFGFWLLRANIFLHGLGWRNIVPEKPFRVWAWLTNICFRV